MKKLILVCTVALFVAITMKAQNVDIYTAGKEENENGKQVAKAWKNRAELYTLATSRYVHIKSVFVAGNDVYVAGDVYTSRGSKNSYIATVQKNGTNDSYASDIHVSGEDVYVAGYDINSNSNIGWVRKNGEILYNLTDNDNDPSVSAMCVSGGDIYICGRTKNFLGRYIATVWKNGSELFTFSPTSTSGNYWSDAHNIAVSPNNSICIRLFGSYV